MIGNEHLQWETLEDPGRHDDSIQDKDAAFDLSKNEKKHARRLIEYEKFLGIEGSL